MEKEFFKPAKSFPLKEIADLTSAKVVGDINRTIISVASLDKAKDNQISFFNNRAYLEMFKTTQAGACFVSEKDVKNAPSNISLLVVDDAYKAFATISQCFYPLPSFSNYISNKASIDATAQIGSNCYIGDFAFIGANVKIGNNVYIAPHVVLYDNVELGESGYIYSNTSIKYTTIGNNFIIHDGVRIGQDGFGFAPNPTGHIKIPHIGGVLIGDNVEIGANTCIDRGAINNTIVGDGTKLDNLVQIAHNVRIGRNCFIAAGAGIAGSVKLEDFVFVGGGVGIAPHITIGSGTQIAPGSGVPYDVGKGETIIGNPAMNFTAFWRLQVLFKKMLEKK